MSKSASHSGTDPVKILFVNFPPQPMGEVVPALERRSNILAACVIPMGICYLSSNLKTRVGNVEVKLVDYAKEVVHNAERYGSVEELVRLPAEDLAEDFTPDIVGFSMMFSTCHPMFQVAARELRKIWPDAVFMTGGNHATNSCEVIVEQPEIDYVSKGECEYSLSEFVKNFHRRDEIEIKGIYSREHVLAGKPLELGEYADDLDDLGFPDWDLLEIEAYVNTKRGLTWKSGDMARREISILTTRGCPFSCTFCAVHTTMGRKIRFRSTPHVIEEMRQLWERYQTNLFLIEDDLFTASRKKVVPLLEAMGELGESIPEFETQFPSALSVNTLFDDVMDALIGAGMRVTNVAIESGSKYVQRHIIKKNCNLDRAKEVVKYLRDRGVVTRCYFIGGFPGETREMLDETREYAKNLDCDWATFGIAAPLRGSEMYDQFVDLGHIQDDIEVWSSAFFQERIFDTPEIGAEEIKDFFYRTNLEVNFLNNPNFQAGDWERCLDIFGAIVDGYPYHVFGWYILMKCYEALGRDHDATEARERIWRLVREDERAAKIYNVYGDLLDDFHIPGYDADLVGDVRVSDLDAPVLDEEEMRVKPLMSNTGPATPSTPAE